jgi:hypothetical protein
MAIPHRPATLPANEPSGFLNRTPEYAREYRLNVLTPTVSDAVQFVGGLMVDRSLEGWAVTVFVDEDCESDHSLQILGAKCASLSSPPAFWPSRGTTHCLAASSSLIDTHARIRRTVMKAMAQAFFEVAVFGDSPIEAVIHKTDAFHYRPTTAGLAYKMHALRAAGLSTSGLSSFESYRKGARITTRSAMLGIAGDLTAPSGIG